MASAITHFIVGASLALPTMELAPLRNVLPRWAIPVTAGLFAVAPDLDTYAMFAFDIPRGSLFSHRGFFHSPAFLIVVAMAVARLVVRNHRAWCWPPSGPQPRSRTRFSICLPMVARA